LLNPNYELKKENYFKQLDDDKKRATTLVSDMLRLGVSQSITNKIKSVANEFEEMIANKDFSLPARKKLLELLSLGDGIISRINSNQGYTDIENKINSYFGTSAPIYKEESAKQGTLVDYITEWELSQVVNFQVAEGQLLVLQKKLIDRATLAQRSLLAKDLFRRALVRFNTAMYSEATHIFETLLESNKYIKNKYQVNYYLGLSYFYLSMFEKAKLSLESVLGTPKEDQVVAFSLLKIYVTSSNSEKVENLRSRFDKLSSARKLSDDFYFVLGRYYLEHEKYQDAVASFQRVSNNYHLSIDSKYYQSIANYSINQKASKSSLYQLLANEDLTLDIRHEILIKLAYMHFMDKNYSAALQEYRKIDAENCYGYERVLLGIAWCFYEQEKKTDKANYTSVITLVNEVLRNYPNSDYFNEAKALIGYVKQKSGYYTEASKDFSYLFESKAFSLFSDKLLFELDSLKATRREINNLKEKALLKNDRTSFARLDNLSYSVDKKIFRLTYMDVSSVSANTNSDLSSVMDQVTEFERLKVLAEKKNDQDVLKRIDQNLLRLYSVINKYKQGTSNSLFGINYFKEHRLARKVSIAKHQAKKYSLLESETSEQLAKINEKIRSLKSERIRAKESNSFRKLVDIDLALERLQTTEGRLDYLKTLSSSVEEKKLASNLDKWANYGAYQLTNIQYAQKQKYEEENEKNSETIATINKLMSDRNVYLAEQIKQIENRIYNMTRRETRKRRIAERNKNKEFYETEFFDERKSEVNEDSIRQELELMEQQRMRARQSLKSAQSDTLSVGKNNLDTSQKNDVPMNDKTPSLEKNKSASTREED
jgi:hypothetical protein